MAPNYAAWAFDIFFENVDGINTQEVVLGEKCPKCESGTIGNGKFTDPVTPRCSNPDCAIHLQWKRLLFEWKDNQILGQAITKTLEASNKKERICCGNSLFLGPGFLCTGYRTWTEKLCPAKECWDHKPCRYCIPRFKTWTTMAVPESIIQPSWGEYPNRIEEG